MKELVAWIILAIAGIGALYAAGLIIYLLVLPKEEMNIYYCDEDCESCK